MAISSADRQFISLTVTIVNIPFGIYRYAISWYISFFLLLWNSKIYWDGGDYISCIARCIGLFGNLYGAYKWTGRRKSQPVTMMSSYDWGYLVLGWIAVASLLYLFLDYLYAFDFIESKKGAPRPFFSAGYSALMLSGQLLSANKKIESQYFWFFYNIISIAYNSLEFVSWFWIKHLVYLPFCYYGILEWKKQYKKDSAKLANRSRLK